MEKEAALADDMTYCPTCKGQFAIRPDGKGARHQGRAYAYHGDLTACGAYLITSLTDESFGGHPTHQHSSRNSSERAFEDRFFFLLLDEHTEEPFAFTEYAIERADGRIEFGITSGSGEPHLLSATAAKETIKVYAAIGN